MQIPCPGCGGKLEIPDEHAGRKICCARCGNKILAPESFTAVEIVSSVTPMVRPEPELPAKSDNTAACRFCGEMVRSGALKCRHCHEYLVPEAGQGTPPVNHIHVNVNQSQTQQQQQSGCGNQLAAGCLILIIIFALFAIIGSCSEHSRPQPPPVPSSPVAASPTSQTIPDAPAPAPMISAPPAAAPAAALPGIQSPVTIHQSPVTPHNVVMPPPPLHYKPGDQVDFIIDGKTRITGRLIEANAKGVKIEVQPGAIVRYAKTRLTPEVREMFYPASITP
ncbi:MAG: hypothetical protein WCV67_02890 [Victivallaceae bacterium]|jgi:hypothetical protein